MPTENSSSAMMATAETAPGSGRFEGTLPGATGAPVAGAGALRFASGAQLTAADFIGFGPVAVRGL